MRKKWVCALALTLAVLMTGETVCAKTSAEIRQEKELKKQEQQAIQEEYNAVDGKLSDLQDEQAGIQDEIDSLDSQLVEIMASISLMEEDLEQTEADIAQAQLDYDDAKQREDEQYQSMKSRIRYIYEKGDESYVELFLEAKSFKDMLNKADYIEKMHEYDRKMLAQYVEVKEEVEEKQNVLEDHKAELEAHKYELEVEKKDLQELMDEKKEASADYETQIARVRQEASVYKAKIKQQNAEIQKLEAEEKAKFEEEEAARKAAEEAARKAAEEAAKKSAQAQEASVASAASAGSSSSAKTESKSSGSGGAKTVPAKIGSGTGSDIAQYACQFVGNPYVAGGTSLTNGADCSGFTQSVYKQYGYSIPRTSTAQRSAGKEVSYAEAQPGDLICYAGHVAIYLGGGRIVHASTARTGIKYGYATYKPILSVRRIVGS